MKISKEQLIKMGACEDGLKRFIDQTNNTSELVDVSSLIGGKNTYDDLLWLAEELLSKERIVRLACDCALLNIESIKPYLDQYKYNLIVRFLKEPSKNAAYDVTVPHVANDAKSSYAAKSAYAAYAANAVNESGYIIAHAASAVEYANTANERGVDKLLIEMFNEFDNIT